MYAKHRIRPTCIRIGLKKEREMSFLAYLQPPSIRPSSSSQLPSPPKAQPPAPPKQSAAAHKRGGARPQRGRRWCGRRDLNLSGRPKMRDLAGEVLGGMSGWEGRRCEPTRTGSRPRPPRAAASLASVSSGTSRAVCAAVAQVPCAARAAATLHQLRGAREGGMRHVLEWLPVFPGLHTYVRLLAGRRSDGSR
jgi:hypothetical protein